MPLILSLAGGVAGAPLYAAGPDGLFRVEGDDLIAESQPMSSLSCCAVVGSLNGPVLMAGGLPYGAAWRDVAGEWQGGWMDYTTAAVLQIAPAPHADQSGVLLAATDGAGILRSSNRGRNWVLCNFGLREFVILALAWAPPAPAGRWPAFEVAFAGSDRGLYRSPAAGLGWQRVEGIEDAIQALAVSPAFHDDGVVLAGGETIGLLRSVDGGRTFAAVPALGTRIDALLALRAGGWLAGTPEGLHHSADGVGWQPLAGAPPALALLETPDGVVAGGEGGVVRVPLPVVA